MNKLSYYNRQRDVWNDMELCDIKNEYEIKELTISQIADIHHRTPGSISYKLKNLGIINHNMLSRGYLEYKNSSLYKEIVETGNVTNAKRRENNPLLVLNDVAELKKEIVFLRKDVKEMLRLMNALYDFES